MLAEKYFIKNNEVETNIIYSNSFRSRIIVAEV